MCIHLVNREPANASSILLESGTKAIIDFSVFLLSVHKEVLRFDYYSQSYKKFAEWPLYGFGTDKRLDLQVESCDDTILQTFRYIRALLLYYNPIDRTLRLFEWKLKLVLKKS